MDRSMYMIIGGGIIFLSSLIGLVFMAIMKARKKKEQGGTEPSIDKTVLEVLPHAYYDTNNDVYVYRDGTIMNIFRIITKDLNSSSESEMNWDNMKFEKMYKLYFDDMKIIALNYPCNTQEQQRYWKHKLESTSNRELKKMQQQRLDQLKWLEKHNTSREFYLMVFAKNIDEYFQNKSTIFSTLGTGKDGLIEEVEADKKHYIMYKMNNKSSWILKE